MGETVTAPELLTMAEVRELLRVSTSTLYEQVLPTLATAQVGTRRLVRRDVLLAWIAAREVTGTDPVLAERVRRRRSVTR